MKTLTILLFFSLKAISQPVANAGSDQKIYLTTTNQVTLNGSSSTGTGLAYAWREVSTDYSSGATITTPTSSTTTVTGLPQGVFYFELQVTDNVDRTSVDTVKITVDYATAPGTLLRSMSQSAWVNTAFQDTVNSRTGDTTNTLDQEVYPITFPDGLGNEVFFDRDRKPDEWIDSQLGKFYSRAEDGYDWNNQGYNRAEMSFGNGYNFDTTKTYCLEWKGYFPQGFSNMALNQTVAVFMQIHADSASQHNYGTQINNDGSGTKFVIDSMGTLKTVCGADSFVNKTHTVRVTFKESSVGGFYKVEVDGVQKLYMAGVNGGLPRGKDYPKIATLYDYGNALVDPTNHTRGRTFSLVTEDFNIYDVSTATPAPTANAGIDQTITTSSTGLTGAATNASGTTATYVWTFISGPVTPTITNSTTLTPTVSGMTTAGDYIFQLQVNQSDSQTASDQVKVTVTSGITNFHKGLKKIHVNIP
jgi:hypothetical protein